VILSLITMGYTDVRSQLDRNFNMLERLQDTGATPVLERLAEHEVRIGAVERALQQNNEDHQRILAELQLLRETLIKAR
jgi:serine phosphatase RsbU (regulator of sigma subunit)